ncbi:energy transducer TonB [Brumimicrobium aurantiacum]|uniref:Energy transducer TonB n=1 Tax=Brumimicrobium aurantiacum TaxID=1737063 RepID=A0A3E1F1X5_9FLAO|nr:energy transducer TonB [Brumimicrobium aurantiacum]RFC55831.1 energy transducer TonB [Brumimicrobium aurantiacum]
MKFKSIVLLFIITPFFLFSQETEREASFPGGKQAMFDFLSENIEYPEEAMEMGDHGKVFLEFVVDKDGSITKVAILKSVSEAIDREAIRVIKSMPKWIPGMHEGELVRVRCKIPINFEFENTDPIIEFPDIEARLKGGNRRLNKNIEHPVKIVKDDHNADIIISLVVNKDGSTSNVKIEKGSLDDIEAKLFNNIKNLDKWRIAINDRKKVRSRYRLYLKLK